MRLDLAVALEVRKSDHLAALEGHDRRHARCSKYAMGALWVCGKRWPALGFAEMQHAAKVGPPISTRLHPGSLDSLSDVRISAARRYGALCSPSAKQRAPGSGNRCGRLRIQT